MFFWYRIRLILKSIHFYLSCARFPVLATLQKQTTVLHGITNWYLLNYCIVLLFYYCISYLPTAANDA